MIFFRKHNRTKNNYRNELLYKDIVSRILLL